MKILVISCCPFSKTQSNGKTLSSFFITQKSEDLAQFYFHTYEIPDQERCDNYYRITEKDIFNSICNLTFKCENSHDKFIHSLNEAQKITGESSKISFFRKNINYFLPLRESLWNLNTWDTKELNDWVCNFKPDVVFGLLGNGIYTHKICLQIKKRFNIPLIAFFTDDYIINNTAKNFIQRWHYASLCKMYNHVMKTADLVYVIGDKMKEDYQIKYKRKIGVLVNSVDFSSFSQINIIKLDKKQDIIVSYIGGLHLNRWKSIASIGRIIKKVGCNNNISIKVKVFSVVPPTTEMLSAFSDSNVLYCGSLRQDEVINQIQNSHFLLHVESFDEFDRLYTQYSISTKIPEYLASKRRILAFGPHEVASIALLKDSKYGCCLTDLDSENDMQVKITQAIEEYNSFDYNSQYQYAYNKFDQIKVGTQLLDEIKKIVIK